MTRIRFTSASAVRKPRRPPPATSSSRHGLNDRPAPKPSADDEPDEPQVESTFEGEANCYAAASTAGPPRADKTFDMHALTAAHPSPRFDTMVPVTYTANSRQVTVPASRLT